MLVELKTCEPSNVVDNVRKAHKQLDAGEVFIKYLFESFDRIKTSGNNNIHYPGIDKCKLNVKNIKKCIFVSDINQPQVTNPRQSILGDNVNNIKGYYRCDFCVNDTFQLKCLFQKKKQ